MISMGADTGVQPQDRAARILVVEEEPLVAIMLEDALGDFGYHVLGPVENPKAAIFLAETEHIDAAVVDTNIDGQIAESVADKLMERGIPFAFVSDRLGMFKFDCADIPRLPNPFTVDDLQRIVMRLLSSRSTKR